MKIYKPTGSKERLFELFEKINEITIQGNDSNELLINSFDALKNKQIDIQHSSSQIKNDKSYVELECVDQKNNKIKFIFEVIFNEGDQDGVFNISEVKLANFKFNDPQNKELVDLDENSLTDINNQFKDSMFSIVDEYVDFEIGITDDISENMNINNIDIEQLATEKEKNGDMISGGLADNDSPFDYDLDQLIKGVGIEMEHTTNPFLSLEISMDHLHENPRYYDYLEDMENSMNLEKSQDDELSDVLLGYKPLNVGDEIDEGDRNFNTELLNDSPYNDIANKLKLKYLSDSKLKFRHDIDNRIKNIIKISFNWINMIKNKLSLDDIANKLFNYDVTKLLNLSVNEMVDITNQETISFDDEIKSSLIRKFKDSDYDRTGILDQRIDQLLNIHNKWLEMAKKRYSAEQIAQILYVYDQNLRKR